jgi:hypothetical protein
LDHIAPLLPGTATFRFGEFDHQLIRLNLDSNDVAVDERLVLDLRCLAEVVPDRARNESLDLGCWDPADSAG